MIPKVPKPFHTIHADFVGPFQGSMLKNTYLLVVVESFSKYVFLYPTTSTKTVGVIRFLDRLVANYGVPKRLICNRGTAFTSKRSRKYCQDLGTVRILTSVATPRANGQAERIIGVVLNRLISLISDEIHWDRHLEEIRWSINTTVNRTTGKSPHKILFGYHPRHRASAFLQHAVQVEDEIDEKLSTIAQGLDQIRAEADEQIRRNQDQENKNDQKKHSREPPKFSEGELVLRKETPPSDGKSRKIKGSL